MRNTPEPDGLDGSQYHVAEVQEVRFGSRDKLLQSMIRGELDYLPHLLPSEVDAFKASSEFTTKQYAIPMTHVIAFNPMSDRIVNAQMRRALSFAVNREGILKSIVLKDDTMHRLTIYDWPTHCVLRPSDSFSWQN
jgi:ABC-type transport system substrate-binding protein